MSQSAHAATSRSRVSAGNATARWVGSRSGARALSWVLLLGGWLLVSVIIPRIPGPWPVFESLVEEALSGELLANFWISMQRLSVGMVVSVAVGLVFGVALGRWRTLDMLLSGPAIAALAIPSIIWALLATMWFGFGDTAPIMTVILSATPFVGVNVTTGIQAIPPELVRMSRAFSVPAWRRVIRLYVPAVMGYLFAGTRLALIVGWQGLLLSEWFGAAEGAGFRARYWYDANRLHGTMAWIVVFVTVMLLFDRVLLERASRWVFRWRPQPMAKDDATAELEPHQASAHDDREG